MDENNLWVSIMLLRDRSFCPSVLVPSDFLHVVLIRQATRKHEVCYYSGHSEELLGSVQILWMVIHYSPFQLFDPSEFVP